MVSKNRLTASRGRTPQVHVLSDWSRQMSPPTCFDLLVNFDGETTKKSVGDGLAQPGNKPNQHFLC